MSDRLSRVSTAVRSLRSPTWTGTSLCLANVDDGVSCGERLPNAALQRTSARRLLLLFSRSRCGPKPLSWERWRDVAFRVTEGDTSAQAGSSPREPPRRSRMQRWEIKRHWVPLDIVETRKGGDVREGSFLDVTPSWKDDFKKAWAEAEEFANDGWELVSVAPETAAQMRLVEGSAKIVATDRGVRSSLFAPPSWRHRGVRTSLFACSTRTSDNVVMDQAG